MQRISFLALAETLKAFSRHYGLTKGGKSATEALLPLLEAFEIPVDLIIYAVPLAFDMAAGETVHLLGYGNREKYEYALADNKEHDLEEMHLRFRDAPFEECIQVGSNGDVLRWYRGERRLKIGLHAHMGGFKHVLVVTVAPLFQTLAIAFDGQDGSMEKNIITRPALYSVIPSAEDYSALFRLKG